ncbi:hypothetical protein CCO03_05370 [Comamonas serinivorans]|uniref:Nitrate reductase associated protein n=1 Tax=Comamonas serinivorans TaxID=1082851 RepID=A0A1Y0ELK0_9BURK|nr:nitrate reductase associated protein [Comamonas serinivorans]ARU04182.1 hypothetical protein CCO03_05370 [Comamonas serinivorans]
MTPTYFDFEAAFVNTLRCVPMVVRFKLDACGIKLSLRAWSRFSLGTRSRLASMGVAQPDELERYRAFLASAIADVGEPVVTLALPPDPAWAQTERLPEVVATQAQALHQPLDGPRRWHQLDALQRFALVKLTRGGHENENFLPALREFGLVQPAPAPQMAAALPTA